MKMIKFEKALQNLAGALIDLANARILIEVFVEKIAEVLDFDPHRQGEGDEATGKGLGIGGGGGFRFGKEGVGGAGGVFDEKIGETAGDVAAGAFGIEAGVIFADGGFGFFPKFYGEEGGGIDQTALEGILQVVTGVRDLIGEVDHLRFEGGV